MVPPPPPPRPITPPPYPPASAPAPAPPRPRLGLAGRHWAWVAVVIAFGHAVMSVVALTGGLALLNREPTNAEVRRAANAEMARRWQAWPVGRIFPERLSYVPEDADTEFATRVGIAPETGCESSVDATTAAVLREHGCRAVLRASYADQMQGVVVTVGVVVFPDQWVAHKARQRITASPTTLRASAFPGTVAARFNDAARQSGFVIRGGPYVLLTTAGQADGRPAARTGSRPGEIFVVAPQLADAIAHTLSTRALPDCKSRQWKC